MILLLQHEKRRSHLTIKTYADIVFQTVHDSFIGTMEEHQCPVLRRYIITTYYLNNASVTYIFSYVIYVA
jgi:hypothetical protein